MAQLGHLRRGLETLFALGKRVLCPLNVGDVLDRSLAAQQAAVRDLDAVFDLTHMADLSVRRDQPVVYVDRSQLFVGRPQFFAIALPVIGMDETRDLVERSNPCLNILVGGHAVHAGKLIRAVEAAVFDEIPNIVAQLGHLRCRLEPVLALSKSLLRMFRLGDVLAGADLLDDTARRIEDRVDNLADIAHRLVRQKNAVLEGDLLAATQSPHAVFDEDAVLWVSEGEFLLHGGGACDVLLG